MAIDSRTLEILIKTLADTKGVDEVKGKLGELGDSAKGAGSLVGELSSLIGFGLGGAAVAGISELVSQFFALRDEEQKFAEQVRNANALLTSQEVQWSGLASTAGKFFDVVRVGMEILPTIQKLANEAAAAQEKQLTTMQKAYDFMVKGFIAGAGAPMPGLGPNADLDARKAAESVAELSRVLKDYTADTQKAMQSEAEWARALAGPTAEAITTVEAKLADLRQQITAIGDPQKFLPLDPKKAADAVAKIQELQREYGVWDQRRQQLVKTQEKETEGEDADANARRANLVLMREQATVLQGIRQQQELISANPFMGADEKQTALLNSSVQEMQLLSGIIQQTKAAMQNSALDPAQYTQLNQKLQQSVFEFNLLGLKVAGLKHPFTTELIQWTNQFVSASHQAATALTSTLGTAINSTSQALTGLIFHTGNWRQTMSQAAQSIVADLIRIALQFVISRTIMFIINKAFGSQESGVANAQAQGAFAAWEPAAIAASTASYGVAAGVGLAAFLAAVASGMVAGVASSAAGGAATVLHQGGRVRRMHSGGLASDEHLIIAQDDEVMIQQSVARQPGMTEFLLALNSGMLFHSGGLIPRMHEGGEMSPWWQYVYGGLDTKGFQPNVYPGAPSGYGPGWTPPGDLDQNVGPQVITPTMRREEGIGIGPDRFEFASMFLSGLFGNLIGFGTRPGGMFGWGVSPTMLSTYWVNYPGVGPVPMGVPPGGWTEAGQMNIGTSRHSIIPKPSHSGGLIGGGRSFSLGNFRLPRLHSGGSTPSGGQNIMGAGQINIHNYTDLKTLVKEMSTRKGRNIIVDTVRGSRIDLGMK